MVPAQEITVYNHQEVMAMSDELLELFEQASQDALPYVLEAKAQQNSALEQLEEIEISLVDDQTIAEVHLRFMDIPGATDVITFDHGEIHISVETAFAQSKEFANGFEREIMLYMIHGLLHLAGHEDASEEGLEMMNRRQLEILNKVWKSGI